MSVPGLSAQVERFRESASKVVTEVNHGKTSALSVHGSRMHIYPALLRSTCTQTRMSKRTRARGVQSRYVTQGEKYGQFFFAERLRGTSF